MIVKKNGTYKLTTVVKVKQCGRRILFSYKNRCQSKSEADLILSLNKALYQAGVEAKVWFSHVQYMPSGSILSLFTEKANVTILFAL